MFIMPLDIIKCSGIALGFYYMTLDILNTLNRLASVSNLTILLITHFLLQFLQFESGGSLEVYEEDLSLHH